MKYSYGPRTCPACLTPEAIIRPDAKTCCRQCAKEWGKMSRSEQQARLASLDPDYQVRKLQQRTFGQVLPQSTGGPVVPPVIDEVVDEEAMFNESESDEAEPESESLIPSDYRIDKGK